ncbi:MAG: hypothetical protein ACN6QT_12040 [Burkholderia contaminans]|uniref:Uncharacterized protein n=1 Tax=Burkholderia aenigmatica TaxID=2015348 RepID=A0A228HPP5_9BURK|nr:MULTISPECIES: hypothetical protein [Burkholderia cepacia complex]KVR79853.1 hypothetical protein WK24_30665 [Burkholderia vietnamiensis]KVS01738.1 hypothetical protein WK32_17130 [Burkholderia vietnamiensis]MBR8009220.1 hypothetical protein [Burkholderia vietnamiensis]MBR8152603.1 hypothetical protein [Burkholderia vietnamiensis]MBR8164613.1 hypothetical protein [Burkholderia vietnamiensis]
MNKVTAIASAAYQLYKRLPFLVRRFILAYAFAFVWLFGIILHAHHYGSLAEPFLIGGAIGAVWASGAHKLFLLILRIVL